MNEEALKNIWELFTEKGLVSADFKTWVSNLSGSTEVQANVHEYLTDKGYVEKDLETWTNNLGLKKKDLTDSTAPEDVTVSVTEEVQEETGSSDSLPPIQEIKPDDSIFEPGETPATGQEEEPVEEIVEDETTITELAAYDPREQDSDTQVTYDKDATSFERSLAFITPDLIDREESEVVPRMEYHFGDHGFTFSETGVGDYMRVEADNGETIRISLDNWRRKRDQSEALKLTEFLKSNRRRDPIMDELSYDNDISRKKYFSRQAVDQEIADIKNQSEALGKRYQSYLKEKNRIEGAIDLMLDIPIEKRGPNFKAEYDKLVAENNALSGTKKNLENDFQDFQIYAQQVDRAVGNYILMKETEGGAVETSIKNVWNSLIAGITKPLASALAVPIDIFYGVAQKIDEDFGMTQDEKKERYITIAKDFGYEIPDNIEDDAVFDSWLEKLMKTDFSGGEKEQITAGGYPKEIREQLIADGYDPSKMQVYKEGSKLVTKIWNPNGGLLGNGAYEDVPDYVKDRTKGERIRRLVLDQEVKENKNPFKQDVRELLDFIKFSDVSDERIEAQRSAPGAKGIIAEGIYGLSESLPSILVGFLGKKKQVPKGVDTKFVKRMQQKFKNYITNKGAVAQTISFSLLQSDALYQEMENDPDFKYVTETEKKGLIIPLALTTAVLETYGLRSIIANKTLMGGLITQVTKRLPKGATPKMFKETLNKVIQSNLAKGIYNSKVVKGGSRIVKAGIVEAETGGLQTVAEIGFKNIWNDMYEKDMFNTPEMWSEEFKEEVVRGALAEAVGGIVMGTPGGLVTAFNKGEIDEISDDMVALFNEIRQDKTTVEAYKTQLDLKVANKELTKEEAQKALLDFEVLSSAAESISTDTDLNPTQTKKALGLVFLKNQIENQMEGMDPDLGTYKTKEKILATIKDKLSKIGTDQEESANLKETQEEITVTDKEVMDSFAQDGININNPEEVNKITSEQIAKRKQELLTKKKQDAVQESSTKKVDVQIQTQDGREVGEGDTTGDITTTQEGQTKTDTKKTKKKKVTLKERSEQIGQLIQEQKQDQQQKPQPIPKKQLKKVSETVSINEGTKPITVNPLLESIKRRVNNTAKALKIIAPKVKIIMHESATDFQKATGKDGRGTFFDNTIHINLETATNTTIAHEAFHSILLSKLSTDKEAQAVTKRMMQSIAKALPKNSELKQRVEEFVETYEENIQNEERLSQIIGELSSSYTQLKAPQKSLIRRWIDRIAKGLGIKVSEFTKSDQDVVDLLNTIATKVTTGVEIQEEDVSVIKETKKQVKAEQKQETKKKKETKKKEAPKQREQKTLKERTAREQQLEKEVSREALKSIIQSIRKSNPYSSAVDILTDVYKGNVIEDYNYDYLNDDLTYDALIDFLGAEEIFDNKRQAIDKLSTIGKGVVLKDIETVKKEAPKPREQKTLKERVVSLARMYNMNESGFTSSKINLGPFTSAARRLGLGVKKARGIDGGYYFTRNGVKYNPFPPKTFNPRYQKVFNKFQSPIDIIQVARAAGFQDTEIKYFLKNQKGLKVKEINELMEVKANLFESMPAVFGNLPGGMKAGLKLYTATVNKFNQLLEKNQALPKGKQLSVTELINQSIEFMTEQKPYKDAVEGVKSKAKKPKMMSTLQQQLQAGMQEALGGGAVRDVSRSIAGLKKIIRQKIRGAKEIRYIKRQLQNTIRDILPAGEYTKTEVRQLLRTIQEAEPAWLKGNLQNLVKQIEEMGAKKNVSILNRLIDKLLNKEYEVTIGKIKKGVKIDSKTNKILKSIKDKLYKSAEIKDDIVKEQEDIIRKIEELNQKLELTAEEETQLLILNAALGINNSKLMDDNNPRKADQLADVYNNLKALVLQGRNNYKEAAAERSKRYSENTNKFYQALTGNKKLLDLSDDKIKAKVRKENESRKAQQESEAGDNRRSTLQKGKAKVKKYFSKIGVIMKDFVVDKGSSLSTLSMALDQATGDMFDGYIKDFIYRKTNESTRVYKESIMALDALIIEKTQEFLGKDYKKKIRKYRKVLVLDDIKNGRLYKDPAAVKKAQAKYDKNPTKENEKNLSQVQKDNYPFRKLTPLQLQYLYFQYQQPQTHLGFEKALGKRYKVIMKGLNQYFEETYPDLLALGQYQVEELMPALYEKYNKVYKKIYNTDLPQRDNYSGKTFRELTKGDKVEMEQYDPLSLFAETGNSQMLQNVIGNSTKIATNNRKAIMPVDAFMALNAYIKDMEHFHAYADNINEIKKVFKNPLIAETIESIYGKDFYDTVELALKAVASRGKLGQSDKMVSLVNNINTVYIVQKLGLGLTVFLKQLTSFPAYSSYIGTRNWIKTFATLAANPKQWAQAVKEISENSVEIKYRYWDNISKTIEAYGEKGMEEYTPGDKGSKTIKGLMSLIKLGDKGAIYFGGVPNYVFLKNKYMKEGMSEKEAQKKAIIRFEEQTNEVQQSANKQDKDYYQNMGGWMQPFNMFQSAPKAYLRQIFNAYRQIGRKISARDLSAGKGTLGKNLKVLAMYQFALPMIFQWATSGFPLPGGDKWDEEDTKDQARAALLSVFNSIFLLGDALEIVANLFSDKPYWKESAQNLPLLDVVVEVLDHYEDATTLKDEEKAKEAWVQMSYAMLPLTKLVGAPTPVAGFPLKTLDRMGKNMKKIIDEGGDPREVLLRMFNYSDYVIEGKEEKKPKPFKLRESEKKEYFPDLYEAENAYKKDPSYLEFKKIEDEMKKEKEAARKKMLEDMYGE